MKSHNTPQILLVNPWIHDFAAFDFWAKPVGLLYLGAILKKYGYGVSYIDCLDRFHHLSSISDPFMRYGRGPYLKTKIKKPDGLEDVPRYFYRYGIKREWFEDSLLSIPKPDLIFVTSFMTYWYPGVKEAISCLKNFFPNTPLILGGIYASLCYEHAVLNSGADFVIKGAGEKHLINLIEKYIGYSKLEDFNYDDFNSYPYPSFNLQNKINYIPIITSKGCPYSCSYCASKFLNQKFTQRTCQSVVDEILFWHDKFKVEDFIFYDDALLINAEEHIIPILEAVITKGCHLRFHTPNALHASGISEKAVLLMYKAGFISIRIGLENINFKDREELDKKITQKDFVNAVLNLKKAGFSHKQVGAYLLTGLPYQNIKEIEESINFVKDKGITPVLAYYTPIPHTNMWDKAVKTSRYDLESDPIFTNNAIFPCMDNLFLDDKISYLKRLCSF